jgi:hypothetical protein
MSNQMKVRRFLLSSLAILKNKMMTTGNHVWKIANLSGYLLRSQYELN